MAIPTDIGAALHHLVDPQWHERKRAVRELLDAMAGSRGSDRMLRDEVVDRLLDGVLAHEPVEGRASCSEALRELGAEIVPRVFARLVEPGPGAVRLVDLLGEVGGRAEVPSLVDLLAQDGGDENLHAAIATALGRLGGGLAERTLVGLVDSGSPMIRANALEALAATRARIPLPKLRELAGDPLARRAVAELLGRSGLAEAVADLVGLLADPVVGVRGQAAIALVGLHAVLGGAHVPVAIEALDAPAREQLHALLGRADSPIFVAALELCCLGRDATVLELLVRAEPGELDERMPVLVGHLGERAIAELQRLSETAEAALRPRLLRICGLVAGRLPPSLRGWLVEGLRAEDREVASRAAEALASAGTRTELEPLYRTMAEEDRLGELAADAFGEIVVRDGAPHVDEIGRLTTEGWPQRGALARNLCRVATRLADPRHVPELVALVGSADADVRVAAAVALGHIGGEHGGASALSFSLTDEEVAVRVAACRALGQLRQPETCQSLLGATTDGAPQVRAAAVAALVALDNPVALPRLREIILEDPAPSVVVHAIAGLGSPSSNQDLALLMSLCLSSDPEVVKAAVRALARFPVHRATAALVGLLEHERWDVRLCAAEILGQRGDPTALAPLRGVLDREADEHVRGALSRSIAGLGTGGPPT